MMKQQKTEAEQIQFYQQFREASLLAVGKTGAVRFYLELAGTTICLCFAGDALVPFLTPALAHLKVEISSSPDLTIYVWDTESTDIQPPKPPCQKADFTDRGDIWGFTSKQIKTAFHWSEFAVNMMDMEEHTGIYWVKSNKGFPYWVYSSPFRTLFHWWMQKNDCQLLHAAAVGTNHGAVLVTGKGGSGKSSTAISALHAGLSYVGDDYVVVKNGPTPVVYSLYSTAKLLPTDLNRYPRLKHLAGKTIDVNPEKETLFLYPDFNDQVKTSMPLKAIFAPEICDQEQPSLVSGSFWKVHRAMSFTTMSQLPGADRYTHEFISALTERLPCYTLQLGHMRDSAHHLISEVLENPQVFDLETAAIKEDTGNPLISVIVPIYNGAKFVRQAVDSIHEQKYPAIELIIIDDGSTDNTIEEIDRLKAEHRYFYQRNRGPASARNLGIRNATGNYIAFLDVDDYWPENNLSLLMNEMTRQPGLDLVRGYAQLVMEKEPGAKEYTGNPRESFPDYIGAGLYRKEVFSKVGLFDPSLRFGEDKDWYVRAREAGINMKRMDEVTLFVRRHGGNMTEGKDLVELNVLKVFKKYLERKRAAASENSSESNKFLNPD